MRPRKAHQSVLQPAKITKSKHKGEEWFSWTDGRVLWVNADKSLKGALSGLRQILVAESPLEMMKNAFYVKSSFRSQVI